jgi:hypothetical protein
MQRNQLLLYAVGLLVIVGLPIAAKLYRSEQGRGCALDDVAINPSFRVRISGAKSHEFCCIRCAETWLEHEPNPLAIYVTDEQTGREIKIGAAHFVRSSVITTPTSGNRIHVFKNHSDAEDHAAHFGGTVLEGSDRPFESYR